jgi:MFS family permease
LRARELTALALSVALVPLNSTMLAVALPGIGVDIGVDPARLTQYLVTGYLLVAIALQSPGGKLSDTVGHKRALTIGQILFGTGALLGYFAKGLASLTVARGLLAAGGAVMAPSAMATLRVRLPPAHRARAFGAFGAVMSLAAAIGPLLGGELESRLGWRALFAVNAPPIVVAAILALGGEDAAKSGPRGPLRADVVGSALLAGGLTALVVAARGGRFALVVALVGAVGLAAFVAWERRAPNPVVDLTLFARPVFSASALIIALQNLGMYALLFATPLVLKRAFQVKSSVVGRILVAMTLAMVVASLLGGRVSNRLGARATAAIGAFFALVGMIALAFVPLGGDAGTRALYAPLALMGAGLGLTTPSAQASGLDAVPPERSGMAAGVTSTARYLGGVAGVAIVGGLLASGDPIARYRVAAIVFAIAFAVALVATRFLPAQVSSKRSG